MSTSRILLVDMKVTFICASYNCGHKRLLCAMSLDCCYYETTCALRQSLQFISFDLLHNIYNAFLVQPRNKYNIHNSRVVHFLKITQKSGSSWNFEQSRKKSWPIIWFHKLAYCMGRAIEFSYSRKPSYFMGPQAKWWGPCLAS